MRYAVDRIGPERAQWAYVWQTFIDQVQCFFFFNVSLILRARLSCSPHHSGSTKKKKWENALHGPQLPCPPPLLPIQKEKKIA